jgi:ABC-type cobalamin/Fe3+-siderophores transport system ATPase subunit
MVNVSVIKRFEVSELFGLHDYKLEFGASAAGETLHETLLYGDNGTGKTTILKLMYHVLSKKAVDHIFHACRSSASTSNWPQARQLRW